MHIHLVNCFEIRMTVPFTGKLELIPLSKKTLLGKKLSQSYDD